MRTELVAIYNFDELNEEAQQVAIERERNSRIECGEIPFAHDLMHSLKAVIRISGLKLSGWSLGLDNSWLKVSFPSDDDEISGALAMEWLQENLLSKIKRGECSLTGYCSDEDFVDSLEADIRSGATLKDAFRGLADTFQRILNAENDFWLSDADIRESLAQCGYREFTSDGLEY